MAGFGVAYAALHFKKHHGGIIHENRLSIFVAVLLVPQFMSAIFTYFADDVTQLV